MLSTFHRPPHLGGPDRWETKIRVPGFGESTSVKAAGHVPLSGPELLGLKAGFRTSSQHLPERSGQPSRGDKGDVRAVDKTTVAPPSIDDQADVPVRRKLLVHPEDPVTDLDNPRPTRYHMVGHHTQVYLSQLLGRNADRRLNL